MEIIIVGRKKARDLPSEDALRSIMATLAVAMVGNASLLPTIQSTKSLSRTSSTLRPDNP